MNTAPHADELESRLYAVHATHVLPQGDEMIVGARAGLGGYLYENEPPSFRATGHFSLGGVVGKHAGGYWEESPYAIMTPLRNLTEQLVNVSVDDTFVIGNVALSKPGTILLVPEGTDVEHLPPTVTVKAYPPTDTLRDTVNAHITEAGGWLIDTSGPPGIGVSANVEGRPVNTEALLTPLLELYPYLSYGSHPHSIRGEAFRFGIAEQSLQYAVHSATTAGASLAPMAFMEAIAKHSIRKLDMQLHGSSISKEALTVFDIKSIAAMEWLAIPECERRLRTEYGVTLGGASPEIIEELTARRHDTQALWQFALSKLSELPKAPEEKALSATEYSICGAAIGGMPPDELENWLEHHPTIARRFDTSKLNIFYALNRTLIKADKTESSLKELLTESLAAIPAHEVEDYRHAIMQAMQPYLHKKSTRLPQALALLERPRMQQFLQIVEHSQPLTSLGDLIRYYPETSRLGQPIPRTVQQEQKIQELIARGTLAPEPDNDPDDFTSLEEAQIAARVAGFREARLQQDFEAL